MENYEDILNQVQAGTIRAAEQDSQGIWQTRTEVKQAILASFKSGKNIDYDGIYSGFVDKDTLAPRIFKNKRPS